ncbi:ComEC/Rec2 family competence protein [Microbacterium sp. SD291]|uniref:ComEC/Rec2 family competence protein n=1 Tax=Microbacterium sp. SD291 TaxID=2782007 RepID=UPI001A96F9F4|nr:ComEC/Rec2 family competence protein [Microbacterium sp. SD291]MBO0981106.1 ComEC/Rec2 family competence protein [Microbacterium sp. SD291]
MRRDLRLIPVAAVAWGVALLCVFQPAAAGWCLPVGAGGLAVTSVVLAGRQRDRRALVRGGLAVVLLAASAAVAFTVTTALPGREATASWDGRAVEITGEINSSASVGQDGRLWVDVQLTGIGPPGVVRPLSAPVRVGLEPADGYDMGAAIRVVGQAVATDAGERSALVVFASTAVVERPAEGAFAAAAGIREAFVERSIRLPEPGAGLLPGLAVGDTRAVTPELNDEMRTSGLSHLTAVSGANCAIVVGAVFWLTALCGGGRGLRVLAASAALAGFVVLVTPEPSVIRAGVMAGVAMLTVLLGRPSAGAGMLALCAAGILIGDPWLASTPGFALSVAASGALILLAPPLSRGLGRWMPQPIALALAVPLAAQLACGPIIALFAEQQSLIGIAANLLAAPAAPIATVIGLLACLAAPLPMIADLLAACAWLPAAWIATTATVSAGLPVADIVLVPGFGSALLVGAVSAALGVVVLGPRATGPPLIVGVRIAWMQWIRGAAAAVLVVVISLGGAHLILTGPLATATSPDGWAIAACDVGQGDALLVRSEEMIALIDTGPAPEPLAECLRALGIDRIDLLVLTHFDLDHVGGTDAVIGRAEHVLHGPAGEADDERLLARLVEGGADLTAAASGLHGVLGGASWRVLWPQRDSLVFPAGNDASVVIEFDGGGVPRSLYLGDLAAEPQRMLLRTARLTGGYAVVKVAHHGSADQDPGLYETLRPAAALFSAGEDNDYGHPRDETIDLLAGVGAQVLRTDRQGRILLGIRDGVLEVWTEEPP